MVLITILVTSIHSGVYTVELETESHGIWCTLIVLSILQTHNYSIWYSTTIANKIKLSLSTVIKLHDVMISIVKHTI